MSDSTKKNILLHSPSKRLYIMYYSHPSFCTHSLILQIYDNYADNNGTYWSLCELPTYEEDTQMEPLVMASPIHITSYLNTLHIRQKTTLNLNYLKLNATIRIQPGE